MNHKSVIENIYVHLAEGDRKPIFDILAPDVRWVEAENLPNLPKGPIVGPEAVQKAVFDDALAEHWTELRINPDRIVAAGTTVLVEGRYAGTTKAGQKLDAIFAHVWDFSGDKVVHVQQYSDTWQFHQVLGVDV
jgi:ketosteroid isomerase-like protein